MSSLELVKPGIGNPGTLKIKQKTVDMFRNYLSVVCANSEEMLDRAFRLRFQVYRLERGFENAAEYPDGRERDCEDFGRCTRFCWIALLVWRWAQSG